MRIRLLKERWLIRKSVGSEARLSRLNLQRITMVEQSSDPLQKLRKHVMNKPKEMLKRRLYAFKKMRLRRLGRLRKRRRHVY